MKIVMDLRGEVREMLEKGAIEHMCCECEKVDRLLYLVIEESREQTHPTIFSVYCIRCFSRIDDFSDYRRIAVIELQKLD